MAAAAPVVGQNEQLPAGETKPSAAPVVPTTLGAPISQPGIAGASGQTWLFGGLLLAGVFVVAWVIVPGLRRRYAFNVAGYSASDLIASSPKRGFARAEKKVASDNGFFGGPRQVSLRLTASKPSLRQTALPLAQSRSAFDGLAELRGIASQAPAYQNAEADRRALPMARPVLGAPAGSVVAETPEISCPSIPQAPKANQIPVIVEGAVTHVIEPVGEPEVEAIDQGQPIPQMAEPAEPLGEMPAVAEVGATSAVEPVGEPEVEAIDEGQPIPHQMPVPAMEPSVVAPVTMVPVYSPNAISNEPVSSRTTTPLIMPEQAEPTEVPAVDTPRPVPAAHTPVQLTFSFEIISVQLTPTFKVRALHVRPASKIVTMRLTQSQHPQHEMHPQVAFEIVEIQSADSGLGTVRLIKSQHQRQQPVAIASPSFEVTALQPVSSSDGPAVVQLAPSEQGQARVQVTADFQMAKVEFSSRFEITAVVLNSTSKHVSVHLAGADPSAIEEGRLFDIANDRLTGSGDSEILKLDAVSTTPQQS